ncbi:hypothetical protein FQN49_006786 [Arthroderma sp. PD_2]|nr:hypothetical protein FQN49_006786 [Arthroderma sp. PD_2]
MLDLSKLNIIAEEALAQAQINQSQIEDIYGCTPLQESLMAWTARNPGAFQAQFKFRLPGTVDIKNFQEAWSNVFNETPILRTRIIQTGSVYRTLQVVVKEDLKWQVLEGDHQTNEIYMSYGTPLIRCAMDYGCSQDGEPVTFILTMHHALFDRWSYEQVLHAVEAVYDGGRFEVLPFVPFVKHLSEADADVVKRFWQKEFQGLDAAIFPIRAQEGYVPKNTAVVDRNMTLGLSIGAEFTASSIIRLAWAMLISQDTQSNDVVYGVTVTGRNASVPAVEKIVGPTIATFPLRTVLEPNDTVKEALGKIQSHATALIPFEQTAMQQIRSSSPESSAACDFQSLLVIQPSTQSKRNPSGWLLELGESLEDETRFSSHILTVICELGVESVSARAIFDANILDPKKVLAMLGKFEYLLSQIIKHHEKAVRRILDNCGLNGSIHHGCTQELQKIQKSRMTTVEEIARKLLGDDRIYAEMITPKLLPTPKVALIVLYNGEDPANGSRHVSDQVSLLTFPGEATRKRLFYLKTYFQTHMSHIAAPICVPVQYHSATSINGYDRKCLRDAMNQMTCIDLEAWMYSPGCQQLVSEDEEKILSIVARVLHLNVEEVGIDEDFFTLGGDSITAMQVVAHCQSEGLSVTAVDIFEGRTVRLITSRSKGVEKTLPEPPVKYERTERFESEVKRLLGISNTAIIEDVYPCTPHHEGLVIPQLHKNSYISHSIWKVGSTGPSALIDPLRLQKAWYSVSNRHPGLRTILVETPLDDNMSGAMTHVVLDSYPADVRIISCGQDEALRCLQQPTLNGDSKGAPVLPHRFTICQTNAGQVLCKLEGKYAMIDAISVLILLKELASAYEGNLFAEIGPSYSSWVAYTRSLPSRLEFWSAYLSGVQPCIFPQLETQIKPKRLDSVTVEIGDTPSLRNLCTVHGLTITNILQVAWGLVLRRYTGSNDVCFGTLVTGRDAPLPQVHDIVGSIFNVLACRLHLDIEGSLLDSLRANQVNMASRLTNQYCSLLDVTRSLVLDGRSLFNTCLSVEQPLSNAGHDKQGIFFEILETCEATEV